MSGVFEPEIRKLCLEIVEKVSAERDWQLSSPLRRAFLDQIWPHIQASISAFNKCGGKDNLRRDPLLLSSDDATIIRNIIINYYYDGPDVNALWTDLKVQQKYQEYFEKVVNKISLSLPKGMDVIDLVQDGWINILENLNKFHFKSKFTTWAYLVIINVRRGIFRKQAAELKHIHASIYDNIRSSDIIIENILISNDNIERNIINHEIEDNFRKTIERVINLTRNGVRNREIVSMRLAGAKQREIAERLKIHPDAVNTIINRIMKKAARILNEEYGNAEKIAISSDEKGED
jgi:RNA polymerase sigma factor (sigma-70 family)